MKKDESWIEDSGVYGTWTFTTQTMTDAGYYKGLAYLLMHVMPNPMQVNSCQLGDNDPTKKQHQGCVEATNHACLRRRINKKHTSTLKAATGNEEEEEEEECVDTETSPIDWSDVTVFFQFGFRLRTGIIRKAYHNVNTGDDWLGPYNMILAPVLNTKKKNAKNEESREVFVSRYVTTPWTQSQLQYPSSTATIFEANDATIVDTLIGLTAINTTIQEAQRQWNGRDGHGRRSDSSSIESRMSSSLSGSGGSGGAVSTSTATNSYSSRLSTENASIIQEQRNLRQRQHKDHDHDHDHHVNNEEDDEENDDPYSKQFHNCAFGDLHPQLPRLEIVKRTLTDTAGATNTSYSMRIDYSILSVPQKGGPNNDLYKLWPSMKKHLGPTFPLMGPYCYGNDPNRAYAIRLSYDSEIGNYHNNNNNSSSSSTTTSTSASTSTTPSLWKGQKGCVSWLPCWKGDVPPPSPSSPTNHPIPTHSGGDAGDYVINPLSVAALLLYLFGVLLVGSTLINCVLSNRLKQLQLVQLQSSPAPVPVPVPAPTPSSRDDEDEDEDDSVVEEEGQSQSQEQQRDRRYDYLEEVVGSGTRTGTGHCNHDGRSSSTTTTTNNNDNYNNSSTLNDSLEEPLLSTPSNNNNDNDTD